MDTALIYLPNITAIIIIVGLYTSSYRSLDRGSKDVKAISTVALLIVFASSFEMLSHIVEGKAVLVALIYLSNTALFVINQMIAFSWVVYVRTKIYYNDILDAKKLFLVSIPALIISILAIVNFFIPVFYTVTDNYFYERTSLYLIPMIVVVGYIVFGAVEFSLKTGKNQKYRFYPVVAFLFPVAFYSLIQLFFMDISVTTLGLAIGISLLYLSFKNEQACVDSLTGLFNRQYFDRHLQHSIKKDSPVSQYLTGIMLDIDKFKSINDTYGHLMGNDAIREAAKILLRVERHTKGDTFCFRYGGDEFVMLQTVDSEQDVLDIIDKIKYYTDIFNESNDKPYRIEFSVGYTLFDGDIDTQERFVSDMDAKMYENKQSKRKIQ